MNNGGCLYIEGSNVGYDHQGTEFFEHLGCGFVSIGQDNMIDEIAGCEGTFTEPNSFSYPDGDADYHIDELSAGAGVAFFCCQRDRARSVYYDAGYYRVIVSSVILGVLPDGDYSDSKATLMDRYVNFLINGTVPDIWVSDQAINFGTQYIDYTSMIPLLIQNFGLDNLTISQVSITGEGFSLDGEPSYSLESGDIAQLPVLFAADEPGVYMGMMTIHSNDPDEEPLYVSLYAECLEPPVGEYSLDEFYVEINPEQVLEQNFTIYNTGNSDLTFHITLEEPDVLSAEPYQVINYHESQPVTLAKGDIDDREGPPVICDFGGPDSFGYTWIDSDEPNGPEFEWFEIADIGQNSGLNGDDNSVVLSLPFTFNFYGIPKTNVRVSCNGYLTFGGDGGVYTNQSIPNSTAPNDLIAPFWDDLYQENGTNYYYYDESNRRFIIQYTNWGFFSGGGSVTFQIQLYQNGQIYFLYRAMSGTLTSATVGIENASGNVGLQMAFNTVYVANDLAVRITAGPPWLSIDTDDGTVPAGSSRDIAFTFDSRGLANGSYYANAIITTNDPLNPEVTIPVTMAVGAIGIEESSLPLKTGLRGSYPNPFNPSTTITFDLAEKSPVTIDIYNMLGQKVTTLVNEVREAGTHQVIWHPHVSAGVYFYRMTAGDYSSTQKMVLLK